MKELTLLQRTKPTSSLAERAHMLFDGAAFFGWPVIALLAVGTLVCLHWWGLQVTGPPTSCSVCPGVRTHFVAADKLHIEPSRIRWYKPHRCGDWVCDVCIYDLAASPTDDCGDGKTSPDASFARWRYWLSWAGVRELPGWILLFTVPSCVVLGANILMAPTKAEGGRRRSKSPTSKPASSSPTPISRLRARRLAR